MEDQTPTETQKVNPQKVNPQEVNPQVESSTPAPASPNTSPNTVYSWVIVGQPTNLLGSREGGVWVFYNPTTRNWNANGKDFAIDNKVDLICEGTTKLVNESNFTFFKITPTDPSQPVFLSPTTIANSFIGYNCKVDTYRRESFDFGAVPTPSISKLQNDSSQSNLETTD